MNRQYYEAILQLRNEKSKHFNDALEFICKETAERQRQDIFISKVEKVKGGADVYLSSKKFAKDLGSKIHERYGGELGLSPRLFSRNRQTSKEVYRLNVLARLPYIDIGTCVRSGKNIVQIKGYNKGRLTGTNLVTGKSITIIDDGKLEILGGPVFHTAVVTKYKPHVEIIHPETFQSVAVQNAKSTIKKKIKVMIIDGLAYEVS